MGIGSFGLLASGLDDSVHGTGPGNLLASSTPNEERIAMPKLKNHVPDDFMSPTVLPETYEQAHRWQEANRSWWESHPMRYDWKEGIGFKEFSKEFYAEIDNRFFSSAREYISWKKIPFDSLIDFDSLKDKDVLEIGVGNGSHAQLLAQYARSFTGIDLTDYAVRSTSKRMQLAGLDATILQMDAECMQFDDSTFDYIWKWGVIHHSSDTRRVLREMQRVLKQLGKEERLEITFEKGEAVRVISGPFRGYTGTVDEVNEEKGKLKVLINIFGRDTPVEVNFEHAQKLV